MKTAARSRHNADSVPDDMTIEKALALRALPELTLRNSFTYTARGRYFDFYEFEEVTKHPGCPAYILISMTSDLLRLKDVPDHKRPVIYLNTNPVDPMFTSSIFVARDTRVIDAVRLARERWMESWC